MLEAIAKFPLLAMVAALVSALDDCRQFFKAFLVVSKCLDFYLVWKIDKGSCKNLRLHTLAKVMINSP